MRLVRYDIIQSPSNVNNLHQQESSKSYKVATQHPRAYRPLDAWKGAPYRRRCSSGRIRTTFFFNEAAYISQMLPFSGQGANQAIEDAGALRILFERINSPDEVPSRISLFEKLRKLRVSRVQIMSSVRVGKEAVILEELRNHADPPGSSKLISLSISLALQEELNQMQPMQISPQTSLNGLLTTLGMSLHLYHSLFLC